MEDYSKYKALLDVIINKNNVLFDADNTLDSKVLSFLGFEVAIMIGFVSLALPKLDDPIKYKEGIIAIVTLIISAMFLVKISWPKKYASISPNINKHKEYLDKNEKDLYLKLISNAQFSFDKNKIITDKKSLYFRDALVLFLVALIFIILSISKKIYA